MGICALPEEREDLRKIINKIFNPLLDNIVEGGLKRVHRIRKPQSISTDLPRDIIVRFQLYEEKAKIWGNMKERPLLKYDGVDLVFTDLAPETLARRRGRERVPTISIYVGYINQIIFLPDRSKRVL